MLTAASRLKKRFPALRSRQLFIGLDADFKTLTDALYETKEAIEDETLRAHFSQLVNIGVDPGFFDALDARKAPVLAFAWCRGGIFLDRCDIRVVARGDVGLTGFFDAASREDPGYRPYYFALVRAE